MAVWTKIVEHMIRQIEAGQRMPVPDRSEIGRRIAEGRAAAARKREACAVAD